MRNCLLTPLAIGLLLDCSAFADGVPPVVAAPRPLAGEADLRFWLENMVVAGIFFPKRRHFVRSPHRLRHQTDRHEEQIT